VSLAHADPRFVGERYPAFDARIFLPKKTRVEPATRKGRSLLVFAPMNNSRRSMRLQAEHLNVWCSNPGSVVGSAGTSSINTISALHTKHRTAASLSPMGGWEGARDDQARPRREEVALGWLAMQVNHLVRWLEDSASI
jgi:hypothetical protein